MPSFKQRSQRQTRTYDRCSSVVFLKTHEAFGGLSNMAGGFPLCVNCVEILTSEALYQACRFPHLPEVQRLIIEQRSPMTAKMKSKPYRQQSRPDWESVQVKVMRWCLRVKLAQNWETFSSLLLKTGERPIVEESHKDNLWGAKPIDENTLVGVNMLGRLLMELRETIKSKLREEMLHVEPPNIPNFLLAERPVEVVTNQDIEQKNVVSSIVKPAHKHVSQNAQRQLSLFEELESQKVNSTSFMVRGSINGGVSDLNPYPKYKESGILWLGQVPAHWETRPAFGAFVPNHEHNHGMKEKTVLSLSYGRIVIKPVEKLHGLVPESFETYQVVNPGDIILRTTDLQNDHTSLRVGMVRDRGIITSAYLALRVNDGVSPDFGFQFLNVWDLSKAIYGYGSGLRQNLDFSHFKRMPVTLPPSNEQAAIVRFLDWANGRLERAIRAKRKVIALLIEQKQAIIHCAVTRGLDPSVPLKPSGIPWLGDIPQHWEILPLRALFTEIKQRGHESETMLSVTIKRGVITQAELLENSIKRDSSNEDKSKYKLLCPGDIGYNKMRAWQGAFGVSAHRGIVSPAYIVIRPTPLADSIYYHLLFRTPVFAKVAESWSYGIASDMWSLRPEHFRLICVPVPPREEQRKIAKRLSVDVESFDTSISHLDREIELLHEYRTRLVADVVTGKLDVREVVTRLPDAPLTPEPETEETEA